MKTCESCRFFAYWKPELKQRGMGQCRYYPPKDKDSVGCQWPLVSISDCCGHYESKEEEIGSTGALIAIFMSVICGGALGAGVVWLVRHW